MAPYQFRSSGQRHLACAMVCVMADLSQIPPTLLGLAYCIEWSQTPSSLLGALFQSLMAKAYTCGLLFSLNARVEMQPLDSEQTTTHVSDLVADCETVLMSRTARRFTLRAPYDPRRLTCRSRPMSRYAPPPPLPLSSFLFGRIDEGCRY